MKSMKKSMFVTTILMVLLLVVALSTATFAWYTAQSNVQVTNTEVTSAQSSAASLAIDKTPSTSSTSSSVTLTMGDAIVPMVPQAKPVVGTTTTADFAASFTEAPINNANLFIRDGEQTAPATIGGVGVEGSVSGSETEFYVINTNRDNDKSDLGAKVTIATSGYAKAMVNSTSFDENKANLFTKSGATYTAVANDATYDAGTQYYVANAQIAGFLRVAMFVDGIYVATWGGAVNTNYGTIANGANASSSLTHSGDDAYSATASGTRVTIKDTLAKLTSVSIELVAWFDGVGLDSVNAGASAIFTVEFN